MFRRFLGNFAYRYQLFMRGRYGSDELNIFLVVSSLIFSLISRTGVILFFVFQILSWVMLLYAVFRMLSRNISKRYDERMKFLKLKATFISWYNTKMEAWHNRKTHKYFYCKKCKARIRVPRYVGKIEVTCPKCKYRFIKKTGKRR